MLLSVLSWSAVSMGAAVSTSIQRAKRAGSMSAIRAARVPKCSLRRFSRSRRSRRISLSHWRLKSSNSRSGSLSSDMASA
eukprot:297466-Alexandrium_andersonii.AAC.1